MTDFRFLARTVCSTSLIGASRGYYGPHFLRKPTSKSVAVTTSRAATRAATFGH